MWCWNLFDIHWLEFIFSVCRLLSWYVLFFYRSNFSLCLYRVSGGNVLGGHRAYLKYKLLAMLGWHLVFSNWCHRWLYVCTMQCRKVVGLDISHQLCSVRCLFGRTLVIGGWRLLLVSMFWMSDRYLLDSSGYHFGKPV